MARGGPGWEPGRANAYALEKMQRLRKMETLRQSHEYRRNTQYCASRCDAMTHVSETQAPTFEITNGADVLKYIPFSQPNPSSLQPLPNLMRSSLQEETLRRRTHHNVRAILNWNSVAGLRALSPAPEPTITTPKPRLETPHHVLGMLGLTPRLG